MLSAPAFRLSTKSTPYKRNKAAVIHISIHFHMLSMAIQVHPHCKTADTGMLLSPRTICFFSCNLFPIHLTLLKYSHYLSRFHTFTEWRLANSYHYFTIPSWQMQYLLKNTPFSLQSWKNGVFLRIRFFCLPTLYACCLKLVSLLSTYAVSYLSH